MLSGTMFVLELFYLSNDLLRITHPELLPFQVGIGTVTALVRTTALGLHINDIAFALVICHHVININR